MVAITENSNAQSNIYPELTPANVETVTVPGPMKAAVTKVLGPKYFFICIFIHKNIKCTIYNPEFRFKNHMAKANSKKNPTELSVQDYLNAIDDPQRREDC